MTLLSVVVPVYKVQGYLRQCLDSLLDQSFTDFEMVAVDDRSPDHSGGILAEYAARDPRVRVVTLAENVGLGRARNAGLDAGHRRVRLVPRQRRLAGAGLHWPRSPSGCADTTPDVLVVGCDRVHWDGRVDRPGTAGHSLPAAPDDVHASSSGRRSLDVLHVAWNKIVRRDLLDRLGFRFEQGWYEDVSFTFPVLSRAAADQRAARVLRALPAAADRRDHPYRR